MAHNDAPRRNYRPEDVDLAALEARFAGASPQEILEFAIFDLFPDDTSSVTSFGAESAVLLHMIAGIKSDLPILFIDTGKHFGETLRYRDEIIAKFGLTGVQTIYPDEEELARVDPDGMLFSTDADWCCVIRKARPLNRALGPYKAWISGRKRYQSSTRSELKLFEVADGRIKVNPLAAWGTTELEDYAREHELPAHPLVPMGYLSIGCMPCTSPTLPGEDPRAGRWRGSQKTECGIHFAGGKLTRTKKS
ncbi:phosphoadenylyl-sulfate reductase [Rhodobium gokarnense]|uniref:Adenosine 5'-phosphosulfate reductase n=1 Tax=Rhodobium gokarnense TaxID=364296 RepID=A0ABT3H8P0_9HYPH|nr:phosphoadenylyl-sulfate reductase [Rhodobium gokarnense]MCW2306759.1 phosphoadenosine phosphosulfate reductase [Rhodobium gokarnense]